MLAIVFGGVLRAEEPAPAPDAPPPAESRTETMAWRELRLAAGREREIWERVRAASDDDLARKRAEAEFRDVITAYENVIRAAPEMAEAYAAYGLLLGRTGNRAESTAALLKANKLDPNIPMVKNQLGNILAEDGNYNQAMAYYLSAIELNNDEPLYHYQLGSLLHAYRDFFLDDKTFDRATLDGKMQAAFRRAAELAPDNWPYIYRYAESFYDLETPDWQAALAEWRKLEEKAPEGLGKQTIRLHLAKVLIEMGNRAEATGLIATITEPALAEQKQTVVAHLEEAAKQ
ncbi:MAG: tetratricopeptide repeat protein [Opitutaceae bacterium]